MKPKHIARARKLISNPWYNRYRLWWFCKLYTYWDHVLSYSRKASIKECCAHLSRYARKCDWYVKKIAYENSGEHTDR